VCPGERRDVRAFPCQFLIPRQNWHRKRAQIPFHQPGFASFTDEVGYRFGQVDGEDDGVAQHRLNGFPPWFAAQSAPKRRERGARAQASISRRASRRRSASTSSDQSSSAGPRLKK
jgi:hypothetical protein